jgi:geranylgeranyl diphosphate synthase type I
VALSLAERTERYRPLLLEELRAVVGDGTAGLFAWMRYQLGWEDAEGRPAEASPGKLLRPTALLLSTEIVGGSAEDSLPAAAAVELVHNFSLLHDDIEDQSPLRRGRATLWTLTGVPQAINTGDGMFALARLAAHRLLERGVEERRVIEAMHELDQACLRLVEGQYLDMLFESRETVSREQYLTMAGGKTAAMFAAPFAMGALLGGADGVTVAELREFGHHVGLAFQAADDLLGIWGDPDVTGKPVGDDLRSRKMTYPVIAALESRDAEAASLARALAAPARPDEDVSALTATVERLGGRGATEAFAAEQERAAMAALDSADLDEEAIAACAEYARAAAGRDA